MAAINGGGDGYTDNDLLINIDNDSAYLFLQSNKYEGYVYINNEIIKRPNEQNFIRSDDVLLNPYTAPTRTNGFFRPGITHDDGRAINIKTRGYDTSYTQVGILTREQGKETILPLMGDLCIPIVINGSITR